jgi:hypothetical protein
MTSDAQQQAIYLLNFLNHFHKMELISVFLTGSSRRVLCVIVLCLTTSLLKTALCRLVFFLPVSLQQKWTKNAQTKNFLHTVAQLIKLAYFFRNLPPFRKLSNFSQQEGLLQNIYPISERHDVGRSAVPTGGPDVGLRTVPLGPGLRPPQHQPQAGIEPGLPGRPATSGRRLSEEDSPSDPPKAKSRPGDRVGGGLFWV